MFEYYFFIESDASKDKSKIDGQSKMSLSEKLKECGRNGWELVAVVPRTISYGTNSELRYIFKRQIIEEKTIKIGG